MSQKFGIGDVVLYNGEETTVKVTQKDFKTGIVRYHLMNGIAVEGDKELKAVSKAAPVTQTPAQTKAAALVKEVTKAPAKGGKKASEAPKPDPLEKFKALQKLNRGQLELLVKDKELDIEVQDYENDEDLLRAVCEELNVEMPK